MVRSGLGVLSSEKLQNIALFVVLIGVAVGWTGLFVVTGPQLTVPYYARFVVLHISGALVGLVPWAIVSARTPGATNALRFSLITVLAGFVLFVLTAEIATQRVLTVGFVVVCGLLGGAGMYYFTAIERTLIVFVWLGILALYSATLSILWETLKISLEGRTVGGAIILTLALFALHRSFIIERQQQFEDS